MKLALAALLFLAPNGAALAANGCAPGTFSITHSPDGRAASVLFDKFSVSGGAGMPGETSICALRVPVTLPAGSVGVYKVDYRGFAHLASGQTSTLTVNRMGRTDFARTKGPSDGNTRFSGLIGGGLSGTVDSRIALRLLTAPSLDSALATLDSVDLAEIGSTTFSSVSGSLDALAVERAALITHLSGTADLLLGFGQPIEGPSRVGALAAFGSSTLGVDARWNAGDGISLLGGAAYVEQSAVGANIDGSALLAGGVRSVLPEIGAFRPFVEAGAWGSPDLAMHFTRAYANGFGAGDASGSLISVYGRTGVIIAPDARNEIAVSATLARSWLTVGAYGEPGSGANLFPAHVTGGTSSADMFKIAAAWTSQVADRVDFTLSAGVGRTFGAAPVTADIDWIGTLTGRAGDITFVEYGARFGWAVTRAATLDAFVLGMTGDKIGGHTQIGGSLKVKF